MVSCLLLLALLAPQDPPPQADPYVEIVDVKLPKSVVLEVGGMVARDQELWVTTRRGELWRISDAYGPEPVCQLALEGLQEPLGLLDRDGWLYFTQRGELSRARDRDGDGRIDELETVSEGWPLSGNYHEYCFGPALAADGSFWITLNKPFGDEPFGHADWRGWALRIDQDGHWSPVVCGLRSPCGVGASPWGEIFYTDNQGEWCASCKFTALHEGEFHGHPHGIESCKLPQSKAPFPGEVKSGLRIDEAARTIPGYQLPAVWIPYDRLGRSAAGFVWDERGSFPPYRGTVFCGDQYSSEVLRISLEKVQGRWQGACYPFRKGLKCGITRLCWGTDGSLWCGLTNRGWGSLGQEEQGLQRLRWRGREPFDLVEVTALKNGFRLRFSQPVDAASAVPASFAISNWTYEHHEAYGCPEIDPQQLTVTAAKLSDDGLSVDLQVQGMMVTRVHMLECNGVKGRSGATLWHSVAWYTLNALPGE